MSSAVAPPVPRGTYFITGAAGFIGTHLARRLKDAGCAVIGADKDITRAPLSGVTYVACDITDRASVTRAVRAQPIDYVVHLAAIVGDWGDRSLYERVNVGGTRHVLEETLAAGAKAAVHISSIAAMGFDPGMNAGPEVPPLPRGEPYSSTKARGELVARSLQTKGAPVIVLRPGDVIGPGSEPWVKRPIRMMKAHQMLFIDGGSGHVAHVYVDNLIDAILLALATEQALGRVYVITDAEQDTTFKYYFSRLAQIAGLSPPRINVPRPVALALAATLEAAAHRLHFTPPFTRTAVRFVTKHCSYSNARAHDDLGYTPRFTLEQALQRISEAYALEGLGP